jgi:hypothetical protein
VVFKHLLLETVLDQEHLNILSCSTPVLVALMAQPQMGQETYKQAEHHGGDAGNPAALDAL